MSATTTRTVYRILRTREIAPGWFSAPFEVGETISATVAMAYCDEQNATSMDPNQSVRSQYFTELAN